jgi:hypothetical protein
MQICSRMTPLLHSVRRLHGDDNPGSKDPTSPEVTSGGKTSESHVLAPGTAAGFSITSTCERPVFPGSSRLGIEPRVAVQAQSPGGSHVCV